MNAARIICGDPGCLSCQDGDGCDHKRGPVPPMTPSELRSLREAERYRRNNENAEMRRAALLAQTAAARGIILARRRRAARGPTTDEPIARCWAGSDQAGDASRCVHLRGHYRDAFDIAPSPHRDAQGNEWFGVRK